VADLNRYSCEQVFQRLDDFLDRELTDDEMRLVKVHLDTCKQCAAEHRFEHAVLEGVRSKLTRIDLPEDLLARVALTLDRAEGRSE
jgi:anti-sigma factor (TIGR02949 family)